MNEIDGREGKTARIQRAGAVDMHAYWEKLRLVAICYVNLDGAIEWVSSQNRNAPIDFNREEQRFYIRDIGPTDYYYDEGYLWKKAKE